MEAIPKRGRPKYDALRQLAQDLITARHGPEASDPLWNLLHMAKEKQAKGEQALLSACTVLSANETISHKNAPLSRIWQA